MDYSSALEQSTTQGELLKTLAHPIRLCIVRGLMEQGECTVNKMQACLDIPQSTISQHIGKLRDSGMIKGKPGGWKSFIRSSMKISKKSFRLYF